MGKAQNLLYFNPLPSCEGRRQAIGSEPVSYISIHSPHARGDAMTGEPPERYVRISIHSPHARGDTHRRHIHPHKRNFNPLPSYEGRLGRTSWALAKLNFNPLPSYEGRRRPRAAIKPESTFQSTPLIRGETRRASMKRRINTDFNPLPSYEGRRKAAMLSQATAAFQSTPLIRGETGVHRNES